MGKSVLWSSAYALGYYRSVNFGQKLSIGNRDMDVLRLGVGQRLRLAPPGSL